MGKQEMTSSILWPQQCWYTQCTQLPPTTVASARSLWRKSLFSKTALEVAMYSGVAKPETARASARAVQLGALAFKFDSQKEMKLLFTEIHLEYKVLDNGIRLTLGCTYLGG